MSSSPPSPLKKKDNMILQYHIVAKLFPIGGQLTYTKNVPVKGAATLLNFQIFFKYTEHISALEITNYHKRGVIF